MNLRQLEFFRAIMISGTTRGAAWELGVSQPAVSSMIKHIESKMQMQLFDRTKGRLMPTDEAKFLYAEIEPLFQFYKSVDRKIQDIRLNKIGTLNVLATPSTANSFVVDAIKTFSEKHDKVTVSLDTRRMENLIEQIIHNVSDVGIALSFIEHPSIKAIPLHMSEMVCVMPKGHRLETKDVIRPADLAGEKFVALEEGTPLRKVVESAFETSGDKIPSSFVTRYCSNACSLVNVGVGCSIVDQYVLQSQSYPNIVVKPLLPRLSLTAHVLVSSQKPASRLVKTFIKNLETAVFNLSVEQAFSHPLS